MKAALGRVLAIAGSDSGGGAGVQADIKTIEALGGYAATAITAVTAQNTLGVQGIVGLSPDFIRLQIAAVLDDLGADAIKTGMLVDAATIEAVCVALAARPRPPLVLDPVMVAKGGARLLDPDAVAMLKRRLVPFATLLTPNLPEAEALTGLPIADPAAMKHAAEVLLTLGAGAVLLKGGHLPGEIVTDLLATEEHGLLRLSGPRIATRHTHGTGCTLASAVATGLAQGMALADAVRRAHRFVRAAIAAAPGFGAGHGPLGHAAVRANAL
ncbi:MAG TPA: bifunctional hydroxymethylpyrimidine kinase/phosphomethylpyrimidine kinase [Acetobacteraceae bacterium]|nr:bifunctional hydroxymethylpyrimidine kinase/phosphomethylpyrimidine kinase [Acetobacteraceae bacterium]